MAHLTILQPVHQPPPAAVLDMHPLLAEEHLQLQVVTLLHLAAEHRPEHQPRPQHLPAAMAVTAAVHPRLHPQRPQLLAMPQHLRLHRLMQQEQVEHHPASPVCQRLLGLLGLAMLRHHLDRHPLVALPALPPVLVVTR